MISPHGCGAAPSALRFSPLERPAGCRALAAATISAGRESTTGSPASSSIRNLTEQLFAILLSHHEQVFGVKRMDEQMFAIE